MDKRIAIYKAEKYTELIKNILNLRKAVLFGSYAYGTPKQCSDIDIGLFVDDIDDSEDYLLIMSKLYEIADMVDVRIEPHLFIRGEDRSGFAQDIEKKSIPLKQ
ncbi:MAG: nucleotidyltransferase domain-containing protein [Thermodesulfovibrionales bacterium]|nr:nucleotidyltransferase domain-containing protein [Thermodesulfovibrionales bacterium]